MQDITATYSPEDNKLRLYPAHRLDAETYARVKAAGFAWAPKQELFVAPMWTPARADLATELAGQIDDEDRTLCDRAEERAERFDGYQERRADDAQTARSAVERITSGIPFGQPILVGHHSERHARRDAERIETGMRRAVAMWETAEYWKRRAAGAIAAAKYKERADVRARRIKGLEADQRKHTKERDQAAALLRMWSTAHDDEQTSIKRKDGAPSTFRERALYIANHSHGSYCFTLAEYPREAPASQYEGPMGLWSALDGNVCTPEQARALAMPAYQRSIAWHERWLAHIACRLDYERAMLAEGGGIAADRFDLQPGGRIKARYGWQIIMRVNRKDGRALSVTVAGQSWTIGTEEITEYEPPSEEAAAAVAKATKLPPLVNYDGGAGFLKLTEAEFKAVYEGSRCIKGIKATDTHDAHRVRHVSGYVARDRGMAGVASYALVPVFLTDAKGKPAPVKGAATAPKRPSIARKIAEADGLDTRADADPTPAPAAPTLRDVIAAECAPTYAETQTQLARVQQARVEHEQRKAEAAPFDAMRQALRAGTAVQTVSAPQLFPTPAALAARMVDLSGIQAGARVLEPSAGTGRLLDALPGDCSVLAVEKVHALAEGLRARYRYAQTLCADFLCVDPADFSGFDAVLMNPPFANADDIKHIRHAARFLAPGGVLVALCANGPRQAEGLRPWVERQGGTWEVLPAGTFSEAGTGVNVALLTFRKAAALAVAA